MPRFVLLYHECPPGCERPSHWDFMLEAGDTLRTWALAESPRAWKAAQSKTQALHPSCPELSAHDSVRALPLGDHRRDYLDFEGPLSGNRGAVTRIDEGLFEFASVASTKLQIDILGTGLQGRVSLRESEHDSSLWTLSCEVAR